MLNDEQIKRLQTFFYIAHERHMIYLQKEMGLPKPWTNDPIFQNYRFCNVFRYLDKTSVWIIENIINRYVDAPILWKYIFLNRFINNIPVLIEVEEQKTFKAKYDFLRQKQARHEPIFGSAFIVNSKGQGGTWQDKVSYIFTMINYFESVDFEKIKTIEEMFHTIRKASGVGNFMAYQYTLDFTYAARYLYYAPDINTFTCLGLGAIRGMNRILYGEISRNKVENEIELAKEILYRWIDWVDKHKLDHKQYNPFYNLHLSDVQHWLCEYDKYMRGGSKKRRYDGVHNV